MSGHGPPLDPDKEDSMSDVESTGDIAQLGMLTISSSPEGTPAASDFDPTSPPPPTSVWLEALLLGPKPKRFWTKELDQCFLDTTHLPSSP